MYGDFKVTFVEVEPLAEYVVRTFTLERVSDFFFLKLIFCIMCLLYSIYFVFSIITALQNDYICNFCDGLK